MIHVLEHQRIQQRSVSPRPPRHPSFPAVVRSCRTPRPADHGPVEAAGRSGHRWKRLETLLLPALGISFLGLLGIGRLQRPLEPAVPLPADRAYEVRLAGALLTEEERSGTGLDARLMESLRIIPYEVKSGDTISRIAERFSLNLDTVLSYNDIRDVRRLAAGSVLQIPNTDGLKHRVSRGEHLGGIASRYGIPLNSLLDWNSLESSVIQPGQDLFIPGARLRAQELNRILGRLFIYPTVGRVSSRFGFRSDPFTGIRRFHNGVDITNDRGTPVVAAMAGRVAMVGYNANYGKYVIVSHSEGFQSMYGHLDDFLVHKGQSVAQGQSIGKMGNTGYSTGPHLHFSIFQGGEPVDPFKYLH